MSCLPQCDVCGASRGITDGQHSAPDRTEAEGCECPGEHECGVTTSTAVNERKARTEAEQLRHDVDLLARAVCDIAMGVVSKNTVELHELARRGLK